MYGFNYAFYAFVIRCLSCDETIREQRNQHCVTGQDEGAQASALLLFQRGFVWRFHSHAYIGSG